MEAAAQIAKEPRTMRVVYKQILAHPEYRARVDERTRWAFEVACVGGHSHRTRLNNAWSRKLWRFLYAGGPPL